MAMVIELKRSELERNSIHGPVDCTYTTFERNGIKYLQIDTYGSINREFPGKKSQSIQFDERSMGQLQTIISTLLK